MSTASIPATLIDLLERPVFGALGTVSPRGHAHVSPMWFEFDGEFVRFTHTNKRAKYRNLQHNPSMSLAVFDPDNPYRYIELRGSLVQVTADPTGAFYQHLGRRYGAADTPPPPDSADRVILAMAIERVLGR